MAMQAARASYLTMGISAELKAKLQHLANEENRTLTNFIETQFHKIVGAPKRKHVSPMPLRQVRAARLTMCIDAELKMKLQELANDDYRNLTDYVELQLGRVIADRKAKQKSRRTVSAPTAKRKFWVTRRIAAARLATCINADLRGKLEELANREHRTLTDFIETELRQSVAACKARPKTLMPRRQARTTRLTMRINADLKAQLLQLAEREYRTLTDFIEIKLHQMVAAREARRTSRMG